MISIKDLYTVLSAMVPLYAAMILAYGSVRWWKIFTPVQCSGINRFVAVFAVPLLSFHFISINNPYKMDGLFILADTISKLAVLLVLGLWTKFSKSGSLDWMITLFALVTLPNTLVMGIPLLTAMYGDFYGGVMVQLVVLQCIIWYTIMLFLFEYRAARLLLMEQFPETAASIISFKVDSDVMSLDGREPLQTEADVGEDGKIRVTVRRSTSSSMAMSRGFPFTSAMSPSRPSFVGGTAAGFTSMPSSTRPSNLTGVEIYSVYSSRNNTPRDFHYGNGTSTDLHSFVSARGGFASPRQSFNASDHVYSVQSSRGPTPRASNFNEDNYMTKDTTFNINPAHFMYNKGLNSPRMVYNPAPSHSSYTAPPTGNIGKQHLPPNVYQVSKNISEPGQSPFVDDDGKELHMFVWSSTGSPVTEAGTLTDVVPQDTSGNRVHDLKQTKVCNTSVNNQTENIGMAEPLNPTLVDSSCIAKDFSFASKTKHPGDLPSPLDKNDPSSPKTPEADKRPKEMPPARVMIKLILQMVGRKLLRNPNTYSSVIGLVWSLIAFRWNINMPKIILNSISILSDAGLGMAMFSLGLFMALQPRLLACGASMATFAMAVRFLTGPAVMAASSIAVGLRGVELHAAIVQAALPQGIVPFVFAREYDLHPDILSTAVIFGMLVALPTTLVYYVLLGL